MEFRPKKRLPGALVFVLFLPALLLVAGLSSTPLLADTEADIELLIRVSKARAAIVKRVSTAVVHISVEKTVRGRDGRGGRNRRGGRGRPGNPEYFDDEFFRRFFQPRLPREFKSRGLGSGSIVDRQGHVLTNSHVVGDADKITVKLPDGREFEATLVGADPGTDIAVIKISGKNLPVVELGDSDGLEVGESVLAIGNPYGLEQSITAGIVSAKGRTALGLADYENFIQTDASINPGNSGGPLVDLHGKVVGVNTAIFSRTGGNQGIGFAVPINQARQVMNALIATGKVARGFLGVGIQDVDPDLAAAMKFGVRGGVLINAVGGPDTAAAKAGIKQGDLIVKFNGRPVRNRNTLYNAVAAVKPGTIVSVDLIRGDKKMTLQVEVGLRPDDPQTAFRGGQTPRARNEPPTTDKMEKAFGLTLSPLTREVAERWGYAGRSGALVKSVAPGSAAAEAGLRPGALIERFNGEPVQSIEDFRRLASRVPKGKNVAVLMRHGRSTRFLALKVP